MQRLQKLSIHMDLAYIAEAAVKMDGVFLKVWREPACLFLKKGSVEPRFIGGRGLPDQYAQAG